MPTSKTFDDEEHRCTEFTADHGLTGTNDDDVFGAFVCPSCEKRNPLIGDPADFREQPVRCMGCTRVVVLDGTALVAKVREDNDE